MNIIVQCSSCSGTGLYCGFAERKGEAVICLSCEGQGWQRLTYTEYTGRKRKSGVRSIHKSAGAFIATGVGPTTPVGMSYDEFEQAYPVKVPK